MLAFIVPQTSCAFVAKNPIEKTRKADTSSNIRPDAYYRCTTTYDTTLSTYTREDAL